MENMDVCHSKTPLMQLYDALQMKPLTIPPVEERLSGGFSEPAVLMCGDNLDGLKRLFSLQQLFDLCYIDPPYNTGSAFIYQDRRRSSKAGIFGKNAPWMQFMLPRIVLGRALLSEQGIFVVSIDDYAMASMQIMLDAVFGEENRLGSIVVCRSKNGRGAKGSLATCHEYLLLYRKTAHGILRGTPDDSAYTKMDKYGKYRIDGLFRKKGDASLRTDRPNLYYPLYIDLKSGDVYLQNASGLKEVWPLDRAGVERRWIWSAERAEQQRHQLFGSPSGVVYVKTYEKPLARRKMRSWWDDPQFYTERGTVELNQIFGEKVFDTPKPLAFIRKIIDMSISGDGRVLDFFAGSGTTAVATAELNASDGGSRQCVLIESDFNIPENSIAGRAGFRLISDITAERLIRSGINPHVVKLTTCA